MLYEFYTEFPPSVNNYYVKTQRGVSISQKGKKFRAALAEHLFQQIGSANMIDYPVMVEVILWPPDLRKRDVDNNMKSLLDAITQTGFWVDDCLVDQLFIYRGVKAAPHGRVFVRITEAAPKLPVDYYLPIN